MHLGTSFRPPDLDYATFSRLNDACFPHEPVGRAEFDQFMVADHWVVYDADGPIAFCVMSRRESRAHIRRIGVVPDRRRQGVGMRLMGVMLERAVSLGLPAIDLWVQTDNVAAIALYGASGFVGADESVQFIIDIIPPADAGPVAIPMPQALADPHWALPADWGWLLDRHHPPATHVLVFAAGDMVLGITRFSPDFPGCSPFMLAGPDIAAAPILSALYPYATPGKRTIRITTGDENAILSLRDAGCRENYSLVRMLRPV